MLLVCTSAWAFTALTYCYTHMIGLSIQQEAKSRSAFCMLHAATQSQGAQGYGLVFS